MPTHRGESVVWPSWRYGPKDQAAVFEREEDVPMGWEDHPSKVKDLDMDVEQPQATPLSMTREQIVAGLKERNIPFQRNAATAVLHEKLIDHVEANEA